MGKSTVLNLYSAVFTVYREMIALNACSMQPLWKFLSGILLSPKVYNCACVIFLPQSKPSGKWSYSTVKLWYQNSVDKPFLKFFNVIFYEKR